MARKRTRWGPLLSTETSKSKRKSRFGSKQDKVFIPPDAVAAAELMTPEQRELFLMRLRIQDLTQKLVSVHTLIPSDPNERSPSPPAQYDGNGLRVNTREQRIRSRLNAERDELIAKALQISPSFQPPADYKPPKLIHKIPIPYKEYSDVNFMGLIIGPRGNTQKRMERETNTRIAIRGRGAKKDGKRVAEGQTMDGNDDDLHVLITADNKIDLEKATKMIHKLLVPIDDSKNMHKAQQLRELAVLNGTNRNDVACRACGEAGHRIYQCPSRTGPAWTPANVRCGVCGDRSHPTSDCPSGQKTGGMRQAKVDHEYNNFMAALNSDGKDSRR